jgi:hypothetical protein
MIASMIAGLPWNLLLFVPLFFAGPLRFELACVDYGNGWGYALGNAGYLAVSAGVFINVTLLVRLILGDAKRQPNSAVKSDAYESALRASSGAPNRGR